MKVKLREYIKNDYFEETPKDRYQMIYIIMMIHGVGLLLPWNMFITAKSYFIDYKLHQNYTKEDTQYERYFMSYIGIASYIPSIIVNWTNIFVKWRISVRPRIMLSLMVQIMVFSVNIILTFLDTSRWPKMFLLFTVFSIAVINITNGLFQSSLFGLSAKFPSKFIGAIIFGTYVSGAFTASTSLISEVLMPTRKTAGLFYFITAIILLILCFNCLFFLPLTKFYRYHDLMTLGTLKDQPQEGSGKPPFFYIFKKAYSYLVNVFLTTFITFAIFPTVQAFIQPSDKIFFIPQEIFTNVTCFLTYNLFTMIGSFVAPFILWPKPKYIWLPVILRTIFIPIFLVCNYQPPGLVRSLDVVIANDWTYWFLSILNGFLTGYITSLTMMYVPGSVDKMYTEIANMYSSAVMVTGAFFGILFSFLEPQMVSLAKGF